MTTASQSEFAALLGVNRSTVTRFKQSGRLVMVGDKIDVEASQARIAETADPNRDDVAARHASERGNKVSVAPVTEAPAAAAPEGRGDVIGNSYQAARAVKERYAALTAKAEYERTIGTLVEKADVVAVVADVVVQLRVSLENMRHALAPILVGKDQAEITSEIQRAVQERLAELERGFLRSLESLTEIDGVAP